MPPSSPSARRRRGEDALFPDPRQRRGRTVRAVDAFLAERAAAGEPLDPLASAALRAAAGDRDLATLAHDLDTGPRTTRALLEVYREVRGTGVSRDRFADELAALLVPADGDPAPA